MFSKHNNWYFIHPVAMPTNISKPYDLPHNIYFFYLIMNVNHELCRLRSDFSVGSDGIFDDYLYQLRDSLYWYFYILFRKSLDEGVFSELFTLGAITLVLNFGDTSYKL